MTLTEINTMMASIGLPYTYYSFPIGHVPEPPYFAFFYPNSDNFGADNVVYQKINSVSIELYSKTPDFEAETQIESVLDANHIYWEKDSVFLDSEQLYETIYEMEILING